MKTYEPDTATQLQMASYLSNAVIEDATGVADGDRCSGEPPSARYYLGTLAPADLDLGAGAHRRGRETPNSLGFEFEISSLTATLQLSATVSCYHRVWPTLEEQLAFHGGEDPSSDRRGREYRLAPAFRRQEVQVGPITTSLDLGRPLEYIGEAEFRAAFAQVSAEIASLSDVERRVDVDRAEFVVPGDALNAEGSFQQWLQEQPGAPVIPTWSARITAMSRRVADARWRVDLRLENLSDDPTIPVARPRKNGPTERHDDSRDHFLFRAELAVSADPGVIVPIEMDLGPDAYRYDNKLAAYASNCGIHAEYDRHGGIALLQSVPAPVHGTKRAPSTPHTACRFDELANEPLTHLGAFLDAMRSYRSDPAWDVAGLEEPLASQKQHDHSAYDLEVSRFEEGVRWLHADRRLLLAFKLANRTMLELARVTGAPHQDWRRFQLVFIVSQLPALAWREHPPESFTKGLWGSEDSEDPTETATVLWYPTAGGKTEAYLGLIVCAMFYDRLRGKDRGVTAWCRLPLRLLALQQTQRQLEVVAAAERVRNAAAGEIAELGGNPGDAFTIGFFAGGSNTPNTITRDKKTLQAFVTDPARRRDALLVDQCPHCRAKTVEILAPDPMEARLRHHCTSCDTDLPIYVVDNEIYRYLPTIIVGTIDKLANIGLTDKFGALLGDVDCECPIHGFGRGGKCHERRVPNHPKNVLTALSRPLYDAPPTLEIIDELHMVREELGAFSGHYEGVLADAQRGLGARTRPDGRRLRMKVIATTATIRGEDRQCDHLFGLRSVVVPLPGPSLRGSFYWEVDDSQPQRLFVGIMPARTTVEQALVRILQAAHGAIRQAEQNGLSAVAGINLEAASESALLDLYRVSLSYVTSLVDFGKLNRSMGTQVNEWLRQRGFEEVVVRDLSGDTPFDEVRHTLDDLTANGETEAIVATSMVSHGVDVDRLNLMLFNGMPKAMSEYIQASSRIGRRYLGVVFIVFNPLRERDRSHYRYHGKFHEYLDRMVEPVAINRWSRFAARRTIPGVLMGEILQSVNRNWWDAGHAPTHLHDLSRMQQALRPVELGGLAAAQAVQLSEALTSIYGADRPEASELAQDLAERLKLALDSLRAAGAAAAAARGSSSRYRATGDYLGLEYQPMTSLRDVADQIPFFTLSERQRR